MSLVPSLRDLPDCWSHTQGLHPGLMNSAADAAELVRERKTSPRHSDPLKQGAQTIDYRPSTTD
jgi:hypothetical protein